MNKLLVTVVLLTLSISARAEPIVPDKWSLTMHEVVGPNPGAEFHGSLSSYGASFTQYGNATVGLPPGVWVAATSCCDITLEGVHYGYSHNMGFMIAPPTFDHERIFDSLFTIEQIPDAPDLWIGQGLFKLPDGSLDPTPVFQLADGSISGLYEIHRVSEPATLVLLALMLGALRRKTWASK